MDSSYIFVNNYVDKEKTKKDDYLVQEYDTLKAAIEPVNKDVFNNYY